jgi:hypothetical protein
MKNLVMGFSTNQTEHDLRVFCGSLRRIYRPEQCDLVIITNRYEEYFSELSREGVQFVSTLSSYDPRPNKLATAIKRAILYSARTAAFIKVLDRRVPEVAAAYPILFEAWCHPHYARWFAYERFLTLNRDFGEVLLTDIRDVVFQAPVFDDKLGETISLFEQDETYGSAECDSAWYLDAWGPDALTKVIGEKVICVGTILGPHREMLSMVSEFRAFLESRWIGRVEQAVFNHMLLNGLMRTPYRVIANISGPIATLSNEIAHSATITKDGFIRRAKDGSIIPVVHMYDRWPDTKAAYAMWLKSDISTANA